MYICPVKLSSSVLAWWKIFSDAFNLQTGSWITGWAITLQKGNKDAWVEHRDWCLSPLNPSSHPLQAFKRQAEWPRHDNLDDIVQIPWKQVEVHHSWLFWHPISSIDNHSNVCKWEDDLPCGQKIYQELWYSSMNELLSSECTVECYSLEQLNCDKENRCTFRCYLQCLSPDRITLSLLFGCSLNLLITFSCKLNRLLIPWNTEGNTQHNFF